MLARQMKQVALRAGMPYHWLNDRVNGHAPIYADDIYALAQGLRCDPCAFFKPEVEPAPIPSREDRESTALADAADPERVSQYRIASRILGLDARRAALLESLLEVVEKATDQPGSPVQGLPLPPSGES